MPPPKDVLLINPPWDIRKGNIWRGIAGVMPPLGLASIAAVLEQAGHRVRVLDTRAHRLDLPQARQRLRTMEPCDWVGISVSTPLAGGAMEVAAMVKAAWPRAKVVFGGVHPTVLPEEALAGGNVDIVARGEGELTMRELVDGLPLDTIAGVSFRDAGGVRHNPPRELIADLDSLPMPAYHLLPMRLYRAAAGAVRRTPAVSMLTSRGCVGRCTFCYRIFGPTLRRRSPKSVLDEIAHLRQAHGIREIAFYDDTFTASRAYVREFCQLLRDRGLDLTWSCFSRVDTVDEELLTTMKSCGCHQITYGFESAAGEVLCNIGKRAGVEQARRTAEITRRVGITMRGTFMFGNPGETPQTLEQTMRYAIDLAPDLAVFNITTPFPGTEMHDWAVRNSLLRTRDWADYNLAQVVMNLPTVSAEEIQNAYHRAYRRFYFRPGYIARRLASMRSWTDVKQAARALRGILGV